MSDIDAGFPRCYGVSAYGNNVRVRVYSSGVVYEFDADALFWIRVLAFAADCFGAAAAPEELVSPEPEDQADAEDAENW